MTVANLARGVKRRKAIRNRLATWLPIVFGFYDNLNHVQGRLADRPCSRISA